eukprot:gnl/TRDRNA2_/TRDRNA2_91206_c0_seq1.p1 gnl/TRDRNA2_/TRDRNA2_91206_c0~~gnl/TRDRNA2_/TRDRNA2_91206_c0_seq1.p1  ORF type:complete len:943 (-),score=147.22 gnl/TRDRNA2_/TRDRNA2_91206_c0_seq1:106-2934(-)
MSSKYGSSNFSSRDVASLHHSYQPQAEELSWLWEDRQDEVVAPQPLYQRKKQQPRPLPVPQQLSDLMQDAPSRFLTILPAKSSKSCVADDFFCSLLATGSSSRSITSSKRSKFNSQLSSTHRSRPGRPPNLMFMEHKPSRLTLSQASVNESSAVGWRGIALPRVMTQRQNEALEFASYTRQCTRERSAHQRKQAARWRTWCSTRGHREAKKKQMLEEEDGSRKLFIERHSTSRAPPARSNRGSLEDPTLVVAQVQSARRVTMAPSAILNFMDSDSRRPSRTGGETPPPKKDMSLIDPLMSIEQAMLEPTAAGAGQSDSSSSSSAGSASKSGSSSFSNSDEDEPDDDPEKRTSKVQFEEGEESSSDDSERRTKRSSSLRRGTYAKKNSLEAVGMQLGKRTLGSGSAAPVSSSKNTRANLMSRLNMLVDIRKAEFAEWPPAERDRMRNAFNAGDREGKATLDMRGIRLALGSLGLQGATRDEKEVIDIVVREAVIRGSLNFFEFVFHLVPEVEKKIEEQRYPKLHAKFTAEDVDSTARLSSEPCWRAVLAHLAQGEPIEPDICQRIASQFPAIFKECESLDHNVDFRAFQRVVSKVDAKYTELQVQFEKNIAKRFDLSPEIISQHLGELAHMARCFEAQYEQKEEPGFLPMNKALIALLTSGVLPACGDIFLRFLELMEECSNTYVLGFKEFLLLVQSIREEEAQKVQSSIKRHYCSDAEDYDSLSVGLHQVPLIIAKIGIADCSYQVQDLTAIIDTCETDGASDFDVESLAALVCKVAEKTRVVSRQREQKEAARQGFTEPQVQELRNSFAGLTVAGTIGIPEVRSLLYAVNDNVDPSEDELDALVAQVLEELHEESEPTNLASPSSDTLTARRGGVKTEAGNANIITARKGTHRSDKRFSHDFFHGESQGHHGDRSSTGGRTHGGCALRFDGYMRLMGVLLR